MVASGAVGRSYTPAHGVAGDWRTGYQINWTQNGAGLFGRADKERAAELARRRDADRAATSKQAAGKARALFDRLNAATPEHPYLMRKRVSPGPCRVTETGTLVVPLRDSVTDAIISLQFIASDGGKRFMAGGAVGGGMCVVGSPDSDAPLIIAEGFATAVSVHEASGWPAMAAFSAGNLAAVAKASRARYPDREIIFAADNDSETPGNPGLVKATEAAREVEARLAVPPAAGDFNDIMIERGPEAVRGILEAAELPDVAKTKAATTDAQRQAKELVAEAKRLAGAPLAQQAIERKATAKRFNVTLGDLDALIRGFTRGEGVGAGDQMVFDEIEPWE